MAEGERRVGGGQWSLYPRLWLRGVRGRPLQAVVAVVLLFGALVVAGSASGAEHHAVAFRGGAAWLPSDAVGQVALLDGASAKVITQVTVGQPNLPARRIGVLQSDLDAYVIDSATGTVGRISGATYTWQHRDGLLTRGRAAQLFVGAGALYILDGQAGVVTTAQAATLEPRGQQSLAAQVGTGAGIVDGDGRLWVVDAQTGDLVWFDGNRRHDRSQGTDQARSQLVLTGGRPALVDLAHRRISPRAADGQAGAATCLDVAGSDATVRLSGAVDAHRVYASVGSRGVLMVADLAARSCGSVIDLAAAGHDLGAPVGLGERVFVPDFTAGAVHVVDVASSRLVSTRRVLTPGRSFTLAAEGGFVFYNDPAGADAGVIRADGTSTSVRKYGTATSGTSDDGTGAKATTDGSGAAPGTLGTGGRGTDNGRDPALGNGGTHSQPTPNSTTAPADPPRATPRTSTTPRTPSAQTPQTPQTPSAPPIVGGQGDATIPPPDPTPTQTSPSPTGSGPAGANPGGITPPSDGPSGAQPPANTQNPPPGNGNQPPPAADINIEASTTTATVGEVVQLRAIGTGLVSAIWSFGDNSAQATGINASHIWAAPGRYPVTANATLTDGRTPSVSAEIVVTAKSVPPPAATGPTARVALDPATGNAPLTLTADASASTAGSSQIATYTIAWGDGATSAGQRAPHTYTQAGTYTVTATVTDSAGRTATATTTARVATAAAVGPTAQLSARTSQAQVPATITADASASTAGTSQIATYTFTFSDGTTVGPQASATAQHPVTTAGTYTINLTVRDQAGRTSTAAASVQLTAPAATPPRAVLTVGSESGSSFTAGGRTLSAALSTAGSSPIFSYRYEFGDGSPGSTVLATDSFQRAQHHYEVGEYTASLTVTDQNGLQARTTATVDASYNITFARQALSSSPGGTTWRVTISGNRGGNAEAIQSVTGQGLHDDGCSGYTFKMSGSSCTVQVDVPSGTPSRVITVRSNARNNPATYDVAQ